ncbi:MAG: PEGA domain-containing protein [Vulcanimicrobiaceae bacterium]
MARLPVERLLIVALLACTLIAPARAAAQGFGALYVSSLPSEADVWVDGSYIGRTPILIDGLRSGKHTVTIAKTGWKVSEEDQQIVGGETTMASVQLDPLHPMKQLGKVVLHGLPSNARVSFDGQAAQPLRDEYLESVGTHQLVVKEATQRFNRTIVVYPEETTHVLYHTGLEDIHSAVVAPIADYLPESAAKIEDSRVIIRYGGHVVLGRIGDARFTVDHHDVVYDAPAGMVRGKLYLPLELILTITGGKAK